MIIILISFVCRTVLGLTAAGDLVTSSLLYRSTSSQNNQLHYNCSLLVFIHYLHNLKSSISFCAILLIVFLIVNIRHAYSFLFYPRKRKKNRKEKMRKKKKFNKGRVLFSLELYGGLQHLHPCSICHSG